MENKIVLNEKQEEAKNAVLSKVNTYISGAPGTGKSTCLNEICKELRSKYRSISIAAVAPSHSAKTILKNIIEDEKVEIKTAQSFGNFIPKYKNGVETFVWTGKPPNKFDILIIDEITMLSEQVWSVIKSSANQFIYVGDIDQFKSVGSKQAVFDYGKIVVLEEQMRQEQSNSSLSEMISRFRTAIRTNSTVDLTGIDDDDSLERIRFRGDWIKSLKKEPSTVVLASTNNSVNWYNKHIKEKNDGTLFEKGDILILQSPWWDDYSQTVPPDFNNGDTIEIISVEDTDKDFINIKFVSTHGSGIFETTIPRLPENLTVKLNEIRTKAIADKTYWSEFFRIKNSIMSVKHSHSMTAWKSQGSTFDKVLIDMKSLVSILSWGDNKDEQLDMFNRACYVSLSRAKKNVIMYV